MSSMQQSEQSSLTSRIHLNVVRTGSRDEEDRWDGRFPGTHTSLRRLSYTVNTVDLVGSTSTNSPLGTGS
jgi:hypothetical protein